MTKITPIFKKAEVVVRIKNNNIKLGSQEMDAEVLAEVVYVGEFTTKYKVGDEVLIDKKLAKELKYFGETLWKVPQEDFVICGIKREQ